MGDPGLGEKRSGSGRGLGRVSVFVPGEGWGSRARGALRPQRPPARPWLPQPRGPCALGVPHPAISKGKVCSPHTDPASKNKTD